MIFPAHSEYQVRYPGTSGARALSHKTATRRLYSRLSITSPKELPLKWKGQTRDRATEGQPKARRDHDNRRTTEK
eukprot:6120140-Pyramimonas_sp.AAC.1